MIIRNAAMSLLALCVATPALANDQPWFDTQLPTQKRIDLLIDAMTVSYTHLTLPTSDLV